MRLGILQTGQAPTELRSAYADYNQMCASFIESPSISITHYAVIEGEFPKTVTEQDVWLVTGSRHGVYDDLPWIPKLRTFLAEAYESDTKIIGICFGHQILAEALGGTVKKFDEGPGLGVMKYECLAGAHRSNVNLCAWHYDQVIDLPIDGVPILSSPFCRLAGIQYKNNAISIQPHPEFSVEYVGALFELYQSRNLEIDRIDVAKPTLSTPTNSSVIRQLIRDELSV